VVALVVGRRVVAERRAGAGRSTVSLGAFDVPFDDPATSWVPAPSAGEESEDSADTLPGRRRPLPPRRRRLRAGAAGPLPSDEPGFDCPSLATPVGVIAESVPASFTKHPFLSGHAEMAGHAKAKRRYCGGRAACRAIHDG